MNREIKLRVYNKSTREFRGVYEVSFINKYVIPCTDDGSTVYWKFSEIDLVEYTGLKDKNDKEIYEGDIVKFDDGKSDIVEWDTEDAKFILKYESGDLGLFRLDLMAVVGNIYENPELLETGNE